jgi:hypothetical protein
MRNTLTLLAIIAFSLWSLIIGIHVAESGMTSARAHIAARHACAEPIEACDSAQACRNMVAPCRTELAQNP